MNLEAPLNQIKYIDDKYQDRLSKLGINTIKNLVTYFPFRYTDSSEINTIQEITTLPDLEKSYTLKLRILEFKNTFLRGGGRTFQRIMGKDATGEIEIMFFNQKFLSRVFIPGHEFLIQVKAKPKGKKYQYFGNGYDEVKTDKENVHLGRIVPEYHLTEAVSKKWLRNRISDLLKKLDQPSLDPSKKLNEFIDFDLLTKIQQIHFPESEDSLNTAITDLSTLELANIHLKIRKKLSEKKKKDMPTIKKDDDFLQEFIGSLPFKLTTDQESIIQNLKTKIEKEEEINYLLQGDVGSGKTIIAIILGLIMAKNGYQTIVLTPTTILAKQHYETFSKYLKGFDVQSQLVLNSTKTEKGQDIIIGTSAVLARKKELIRKPGLIIVDEQHRFGVHQREELLAPISRLIKNPTSPKGFVGQVHPHYMNMTATPIPRTITESLFADLEVGYIRTKPANRLPIRSYLVKENKREDSLNWITERAKVHNEQGYWICPLVEDSDTLQVESAIGMYGWLKDKLPNLKIALLHGKMKDSEKGDIMAKFKAGETDLLVSTSVIEVGIDVPNATFMFIENAERFGLAQLHQMRGRVGRGDKQSYCFIFYDENLNEFRINKLKFFCETNDGQRISEFDLSNRGPGEVYGIKQSGIPNLKIANFANIELIKESKKLANTLWDNEIREIYLFEDNGI